MIEKINHKKDAGRYDCAISFQDFHNHKTKSLHEIREKIKQGFYSSPEVLLKIAEKILNNVT